MYEWKIINECNAMLCGCGFVAVSVHYDLIDRGWEVYSADGRIFPIEDELYGKKLDEVMSWVDAKLKQRRKWDEEEINALKRMDGYGWLDQGEDCSFLMKDGDVVTVIWRSDYWYIQNKYGDRTDCYNDWSMDEAKEYALDELINDMERRVGTL